MNARGSRVIFGNLALGKFGDAFFPALWKKKSFQGGKPAPPQRRETENHRRRDSPARTMDGVKTARPPFAREAPRESGVQAKYLPTCARGLRCSGGEQHEVCCAGREVVWTAGGVVRQTLELQREVVDADWVSFAVEGDPIPPPPTLCVLTEEELTSYSAGEAHATALPGPAGRIWPLSKGLLLQEVGSGRVWFLGGSLSELLRVVIPGPGEGLVLCFVSARGDEPYLVFFDSGRGEHRVFRYEYGREDSAAPGSVTSIRLQSLEMRWSSYQYPEAASWVGLATDERGETALHLLQGKTSQLVAFSLPGEVGGEQESGVVSECFSLPAVCASSLTPSSCRENQRRRGPSGLIILTPDSKLFLHLGAWCVCQLDVGHKVVGLELPRLEDSFVARLSDGSAVRVSVRLEAFFRVTKDAMAALEVALPRELYHEVCGAFLANLQHTCKGSFEEEWSSFQDAFSDLVETRAEEAAAVQKDDSPDWDHLLRSSYHRRMAGSDEHGAFLSMGPEGGEGRPEGRGSVGAGSGTGRKLGQTQLWLLLESLHALYEDCRLDMTRWPCIPSLLPLLRGLATLIGGEANQYEARYELDMSESCGVGPSVAERMPKCRCPADMYQALVCVIDSSDHSAWLPGVLDNEKAEHLDWSRRVLRLYLSVREYCFSCFSKDSAESPDPTIVIRTLIRDSWSLRDLHRLPFGLAVPVQEVIQDCRDNPQLDWPGAVYMILNRQDLAANCPADDDSLLNAPYSLNLQVRSKERQDHHEVDFRIKNSSVSASNNTAAEGTRERNDGMSGIDKDSTRLRFSQDLRLKEARKTLSSSHARPVQLPKGMDLSHPETNNVQQTKLFEMAMKTMALPVGRGAFSLSTLTPLPTEPFRIPDLILSGTLPHQNNAQITLDTNNLVTQNMLDWPEFHNGVAAGLQLAKGQAQLTRTWIVYNKSVEPSNSHAGFLMALGLQGHLGCLSITDIYRYLSQEDDMTTIGVLLGVSAASTGSMDTTISKMLFLHIPARHPAHYPELELSSLIQAAALVGVGLLYLGSSHRIMTEVLLEEIIRKPSTDSWRDQEGYALAAGIGLGLVNLARGPSTKGLSDMDLEGKLCYFMNGGATFKYSNQMKTASDSFAAAGNVSAQVMEDNLINLNVTSPAAAYALGLMYLQTNDKTIASRFSNPESNFALDFVRPDFILLRVLFRSLIMWNEVKATSTWIEEQIPKFLRNAVSEDGSVQHSTNIDIDICEVDPHTIAQCHLYALTGASIALGVRYAGSSDRDAKKILLDNILKLLTFKSKSPDIAMVHASTCNRADKPTLEQCICVIALSLSLVMAGSGDLETFKLLRSLHMRDNTKSGRITYATSMSVSMAIGFLFLGGGQLSFGTSPKAIAAILVSLFPHFPTSTTDNRSHLQALRHLYVLGVENRCMEAVDVESWREVRCLLEIEVEEKGGTYNYECLTPTILPERSKIRSIMVKGKDGKYWRRPVKVSASDEEIEENSSDEVGSISIPPQRRRLYVKRKLGQRFTGRTFHGRSDIQEIVGKYTTDPHLLGFAHVCSEGDDDFSKTFSERLYECLAEDKPTSLTAYLAMYMTVDGFQLTRGVGRALNVQNMNVARTFCSKLSVLLDRKPSVEHGFIRACWSKVA